MKKTLFLLILSSSLNAQTVTLLSGLAYTSPRIDYLPEGVQTSDVFSVSQLNPGATFDWEYYDRSQTTLSLQLVYQKLSGAMPSGSEGFYRRQYGYFNEDYKMHLLSLSPVIKFYPIQNDKIKLGFFLGQKVIFY